MGSEYRKLGYTRRYLDSYRYLSRKLGHTESRSLDFCLYLCARARVGADVAGLKSSVRTQVLALCERSETHFGCQEVGRTREGTPLSRALKKWNCCKTRSIQNLAAFRATFKRQQNAD